MKKGQWCRTRYAVYKITMHLIFVVKYRKKVLTNSYLLLIDNVFKRTFQELGCELIEFGGEADHVHLLVGLSPKVAICRLVRRLKGASSHELRKKFGKEIKQRLWGKHLWSPSYCVVSCGGASLDIVKRYVQNQGRA